MANIGFLLDMDGVIYRGSELIPGAYDFVTRLRNLRRGSHRDDPDEFIFGRVLACA